MAEKFEIYLITLKKGLPKLINYLLQILQYLLFYNFTASCG